jgi:hypothetical protein
MSGYDFFNTYGPVIAWMIAAVVSTLALIVSIRRRKAGRLKQQLNKKQDVLEKEGKTCPNCGYRAAYDHMYCKKCGQKL